MPFFFRRKKQKYFRSNQSTEEFEDDLSVKFYKKLTIVGKLYPQKHVICALLVKLIHSSKLRDISFKCKFYQKVHV